MSLQLKVKMLTEEHTLKADSKITVLELKKRIAKQINVPAYSQKLATNNGEVLLNCKRLCQHNLKTGDVLLLMVEQDRSMDILVRNDNHTNTYRIQLSQTVSQLKKMVQERESVRVNQFNLIFEEKLMQENDHLGEYDLSPLCTIQMTLQLRGGFGRKRS
ncbi:ubiquitin-like protein ISG15 [Macrotis lagotis]|uniref:ubiquitin-like protein ISG15 n=1 Tax=Macrotis lagotis TaxID=92651 RepID=UPI003D6942DB